MTKLPNFVGSSPAMRKVYQFASKAAKSARPVLITGQTGTGKTALARAIHDAGQQPKRPFVSVVLGELHDNLFETHMFGCKKGAFTGSVADTGGFIEQAHCGTLFLDEVAELPMHLQAKLLGTLDNQSYRRVGDTAVRYSSFRLIAATNTDLAEAVKAGKFRADLFYRISSLAIKMPCLTGREDDIREFVRSWMAKHGRGKRLTTHATTAMCKRDWPGNYRDLENALVRLVELTDAKIIKKNAWRP